MVEENIEAIRRLDEEILALQKEVLMRKLVFYVKSRVCVSFKAKHLESLEKMNSNLSLRKEAYGDLSEKSLEMNEKIAETCNILAMENLSKSKNYFMVYFLSGCWDGRQK